MRVALGIGLCSAFLALGCGGGAPPPEAPAQDPAPEVENDPPETWGAETDKPAPEGSSEDGAPKADASTAEPQFTDTMSVDEAINAVPSGIERSNIDPETLGKPLQNLELYEPCKPGTARVKLRVAVWDGRAVGVDVTTTPKNEKLADCIKGKIRELKWEKKVRSLNTIEYQF
jgi:hypothetical protein